MARQRWVVVLDDGRAYNPPADGRPGRLVESAAEARGFDSRAEAESYARGLSEARYWPTDLVPTKGES